MGAELRPSKKLPPRTARYAFGSRLAQSEQPDSVVVYHSESIQSRFHSDTLPARSACPCLLKTSSSAKSLRFGKYHQAPPAVLNLVWSVLLAAGAWAKSVRAGIIRGNEKEVAW
jgi:hypothetical protein